MSSRRNDYVLLLNKGEYEDEMMRLAHRRDLRQVRIASFGVQCGVSATGAVFPNNWAYNFLNCLQSRKSAVRTEVLVGYNGDKMPIVAANAASIFHALSWYLHPESHLKLSLFSFSDKTSVVILGGRNLSSSDWLDVSLRTVDECVVLRVRNLFDLARGQGHKIIPMNLGDMKLKGF